MEDGAAKAARSRRDSSMHVACRLVSSGQADGLVSAGNTGASWPPPKSCSAWSLESIGPLWPAFSHHAGKPVVVVDVGANVDCSARQLAQFAVMAEIYSRMIIRSRPNPRVGILSIGEEEHKGNDLTRSVASVLKRLDLNFIGNVEGSDIYAGDVDVIVCDGFVGNVALKVSEGVVDLVKLVMRESLEASITGKIGYAIAKNAFTAFRKRLDYSEYGGAPLLGVQRRLHYLPRPLQRQRHQERHPRRQGILRRRTQSVDRERVTASRGGLTHSPAARFPETIRAPSP